MTQPDPYHLQPQYPPQNHPQQRYPAPQYQPQPQLYPNQQYPSQHPAQLYPNQQYPSQSPAQPHPAQQYLPPPIAQCRICGCVPAADVKFRGHQGMIVIMRFLSLDGPFCRDCGLATFRQMTARTLVQGWYGYASFVITPITVLINIVRREKVASLAPPQPVPGGSSRQPMDPGPPLLARPMAIIGLGIPVALVMLIVLLIVASSG